MSAESCARAFLAVDDEARIYIGDPPHDVARRWCEALDRWMVFYRACRDALDYVPRGTPYATYRYVAEKVAEGRLVAG